MANAPALADISTINETNIIMYQHAHAPNHSPSTNAVNTLRTFPKHKIALDDGSDWTQAKWMTASQTGKTENEPEGT